ncbi:hypothetical protein STEG23_010656 [Scotinomys teguina]
MNIRVTCEWSATTEQRHWSNKPEYVETQAPKSGRVNTVYNVTQSDSELLTPEWSEEGERPEAKATQPKTDPRLQSTLHRTEIRSG